MKLHVYFTPAEVAAVRVGEQDVYIVIDVIRATTSMAVIFERGAERIFAANTIEQARLAARSYPARLLCGERHALPLPDFDYGNSPTQFARAEMAGREVILTTTNGSRAFYACPEQSVRLAGSFYNAEAVTRRALKYARERGGDIALVCAGEAGYFALDDSTCAGYLALELQRQEAGIECDESVLAAQAIYGEYAPPRMLEYGNSARSVIAAGQREDLEMCVRVSVSEKVPMVSGREEETGLLCLTSI